MYASRADCAATATAIERAMANKWTDVGKEYKAKFRQLSFNLRDPKNPDLRAQVADGLIDPVSLLDLAPEQLASAERRTENEAIREHATNEAVRGQRKGKPPRMRSSAASASSASARTTSCRREARTSP